MRDVRDVREMREMREREREREREKELREQRPLAPAVEYIKRIRQNCTPSMFEQFLTILGEWNNGQVGIVGLFHCFFPFSFIIFFYIIFLYYFIFFKDWY